MFTQPSRYGSFGVRDNGIGRTRKACFAVWYVAMTVPAGSIRAVSYICFTQHTCLYKFLIELRVTPYAIFVYNHLTFGDSLHPLRFVTHSEDVGVSESVGSLEIIFCKNACVWYVAVVAGSYVFVRTVLPSGVVRTHYVAVDTHFGIVAEITVCFLHIYEVCHQTAECTRYNQSKHLKIERGQQRRLQSLQICFNLTSHDITNIPSIILLMAKV